MITIMKINNPSLKDLVDISEEEKEAAKLARDFVSNLVLHKYVRLENIASEKYGRILADVYINDINLNDPDIITYKLVQSNIDGYENY